MSQTNSKIELPNRILLLSLFIWSLINAILNLVGFGIHWLVIEPYLFFGFFNQFKHVGLQIIEFGIVFLLTFFLTKNFRIALYSFSILQVIVFHAILIFFLQFEDGQLLFVAPAPAFATDYLYLNQQELIDLISFIWPLEGIFDDGMMVPDLFRYYIIDISLNLGYFFIITWVTEKLVNLLG
jgi:hypothetical protein